MIETVFYSIGMVLGVFGGEIVSQFAFGPLKSVKKTVFEMVLFVLLVNFVLSSILLTQTNMILLFLIYFFITFFCIISVRSVIYMVFRTANKVSSSFKEDENSKRLIRLARSLQDKYSKSEIIKLFKKAGFKKEKELFEKVLR